MSSSSSSRYHKQLSQKSSGGKKSTVSSASSSSAYHHSHSYQQQQQGGQSPQTIVTHSYHQPHHSSSSYHHHHHHHFNQQQQHQHSSSQHSQYELIPETQRKPMRDILEEAAVATGVDVAHLTGAKIRAKCCPYCVWCYCACIQGEAANNLSQCCNSDAGARKRRRRQRATEPPLERYLVKNFACMCFFAFLTGADFAVILPTLWDRLTEDMNAEGTFMGLVISAYSFSGVLMGLIMGKLSDDYKQTKPFLAVASVFSILGHLIYFVGINKWVLLASRAIAGLSLGASTVALAYIARTTSEQRRTSIISMVMATRQLGLMLGPAFNLFLRKCHFTVLAEVTGGSGLAVNRKSAPGLFMAALWLISFVVFLLAYSDSPPKGKQKKGGAGGPSSSFTVEKSSNVTIHSSSQTEPQQQQIPLIPLNTVGAVEEIVIVPPPPRAPSQAEDDTEQQRAPRFADYKREFMRIEIFVLLVTTFFTYFNQTSLETIVTPFTKYMFGWHELHNSLLFCAGGFVIILSYIVVRLLSVRFSDRLVLVLGICSILLGLCVACSCLPFADTRRFEQAVEARPMLPSASNDTEAVAAVIVGDYSFFPAFVIFVLLDVLGLPAIAICSVSLFTKMIDNKTQGLGQGLQRGILGIATIVGPLVAGPLITKPIVLLASTLFFIALILIMVLVSYKRLKQQGPPSLTIPMQSPPQPEDEPKHEQSPSGEQSPPPVQPEPNNEQDEKPST